MCAFEKQWFSNSAYVFQIHDREVFNEFTEKLDYHEGHYIDIGYSDMSIKTEHSIENLIELSGIDMELERLILTNYTEE